MVKIRKSMNKILYFSVVLLFFYGCGTSTDFETDMMQIKINNKGFITAFIDKESSIDYLPKGVPSPLLSLYKDSIYLKPISSEFDLASNIFILKYKNGSVAKIKFETKPTYFRIELQSVEPRNDIEAIQWGPFSTTLDKWIGETVGIVRNNDFSIGVQALNIYTVEGTPSMESHKKGRMVIDPLAGQKLPESLQHRIGQDTLINVNRAGDIPEYVRIYRGNAAMKNETGSEILFYARDRREPRIVGSEESIQYIEAVDQDFTGSAIALFGCPEPKTLDIIEKIELSENLPHPVFEGEWIKRHSRLGEPYLMYEGHSQEKALEYANLFDFKLIHIGDIFKSWGHFGLETNRFPDGAKAIKAYTDKARDDNISLGVHTLTMFTSTHDPYVSPVPSDSLCKIGSSRLSRAVGQDDNVIYIEDPTYFLNKGKTQTVKIGKELIKYGQVVDQPPYRLENCTRGQYGTKASAHKIGSVIDNLANNVYSGFYPDFHLQDDFALRLAEVCNETGIDLMDFDGFDLNPTGHDTYADAKFIDTWYKNLDRARMVCGSQTSHYYWHIYTFMNWGEPWYSALRQSQVNYRIENQRYFERNFMPGMLGWFSLHPDYRLEDIEWIQARSVAFNAGYLLRVDDNSIRNSGFINQISEAVREWQKARKARAFTDDLIEKMKNPELEYHLEKSGENSWNIYPVKYEQNAAEFKYKKIQIGEPIISNATFVNQFEEQPIRFYLTAHEQNGNKSAAVEQFSIEINNTQSLEIEYSIKAGDRIFCDGDKIYLCDSNWKKVKELGSSYLPKWQNANNSIVISGSFTSADAPRISLDWKAMGSPEEIHGRP